MAPSTIVCATSRDDIPPGVTVGSATVKEPAFACRTRFAAEPSACRIVSSVTEFFLPNPTRISRLAGTLPCVW